MWSKLSRKLWNITEDKNHKNMYHEISVKTSERFHKN